MLPPGSSTRADDSKTGVDTAGTGTDLHVNFCFSHRRICVKAWKEKQACTDCLPLPVCLFSERESLWRQCIVGMLAVAVMSSTVVKICMAATKANQHMYNKNVQLYIAARQCGQLCCQKELT